MGKFNRGDDVKAANGAEGKVIHTDSARKLVAVKITEGTPNMSEGSEQVFKEKELRKR
jgi:hypothetical protein